VVFRKRTNEEQGVKGIAKRLGNPGDCGMASGYEKSPDYGGPQFKPWLYGLGLFLFLLAAMIYRLL
jgi:hypothetical protein